jgi:hypothetical protein
MQMKKYRMDDEKAPDVQADPKPPASIDAWQQYIADYEADIKGDVSFSEETIEEEFAAYATSLPKRPVNAIKFWEVNNISNNILLL